VNSEAGDPSFTRRLIESAAIAAARGSGTSSAAALNAMRLPAIALDEQGFVAEVNAAAEAIFDNDFRIKDRRLFVRDPAARALLNAAVDQLKTSPHLSVRTNCRSSCECEFGVPTARRTCPRRKCARF
jgi:PAS domain-containing protein